MARGLTQQELADAVSTVHWRLFGREAAIDANHVSKLERGVIARPNRRYREAFRAVLGAATDAHLGFGNYPRISDAGAQEVDDMRRIEFLRLAAGLGVGATIGEPTRLVTSSGPGQLGAGDVALIRDVTTASRRLRGIYGGAASSTSVAGQVQWATGLLSRPCTGPIRRDVHAAVGALASMAGWGEVDAGNQSAARKYHELALYCAEESASWGLRAEVLKDMGLAALYRNDADEALSLVEMAQVRADRTPPAGRVLVAAAHARGLAAAGRLQDAAARLLAVEDQIVGGSGVAERAAIAHGSYFAEASTGDLAYELALAAAEVAAYDDRFVGRATTCVQGSLARPELPAIRRAKLTSQLAYLQLRAGDHDRAHATTDRVIALSGGLPSAPLAANLRRLRRSLARSPHPESRARAAVLGDALASP